MAHIANSPNANFASDERGTVAVVFALTSLVLFLVAGMAIDLGRVYHTASRISASLDAAALAGAKGMRLENLNNAGVTTLTRQYFDIDFTGPAGAGTYATVTNFAVDINRNLGSVGVTATARVPTLFVGLIGINEFTVPRNSVAIFDQKDLEIGLQLDVTGSMAGPKLAALKVAAKDLFDILIPDAPTGQKVRIGLAPFSAGVNVGRFIRAVDGNRASANTCTYERLTPTNDKTDAAPVGPDAYKIRADFPVAIQNCPTATVKPLTDDKASLKSDVDSYAAAGSTAGQLGAAWAWNLVSPNWASVWGGGSAPAAYDDGRTIKSVILMTDGDYNTVGGVSKNANVIPASRLSVEICAGMKAKGIIVYTVGFQLAGNQTAINTLSACASSASKFYRAENEAALNAAFREIATDIVSLRLSS